MPRFDPPIVFLICAIFLGLGAYNFIVGRRRLREARLRGLDIAWYKQASILTAIEYLLVVCIMLLNLGMTTNWFPTSLAGLVISLYLTSLVLAAVVIIAIIFWAVRGTRGLQSVTEASSVSASTTTPAQRSAQNQKKRERRQKAAIARRRRAGRA